MEGFSESSGSAVVEVVLDEGVGDGGGVFAGVGLGVGGDGVGFGGFWQVPCS